MAKVKMAGPDKIVVLNNEDYPSNSKRSKEAHPKPNPEPRPRRGQIASAKRIKKPLLKRFADTFLEGGTGHDIGNYIMHDVVIPAAKSTIADLVEGAIEMLLFNGEGGRSRHATRRGGRSYVAYNSMYAGSTRRDDGRPPVRRPHNVERATTGMSRNGVESIVLPSRQEAEIVLGELIELLNEYQVVTLSDLYDLTGLASDFTDNKYGWFELPECSTMRVRDGWALVLPRPVIVD
jgi:hypothetical protein